MTEIPLTIRESIVRNLIVTTFMEATIFFLKNVFRCPNLRVRPYKKRMYCDAVFR